MVVALGGRHGNAFFAWSQMTSNGVARISDASILAARALVARTRFGDTTIATATGIGTAVGFDAFALQFGLGATVWTVFPLVLASGWWFRQREFWAGRSILAAVVAFVEGREIVLVASASGIIELHALTASNVVGPSTLVMMASSVIDLLAAAFFIAFVTTSTRQIAQ